MKDEGRRIGREGLRSQSYACLLTPFEFSVISFHGNKSKGHTTCYRKHILVFSCVLLAPRTASHPPQIRSAEEVFKQTPARVF